MNTKDQRTLGIVRGQMGTILKDLRRLRDAQPEEASMDRDYIEYAIDLADELYTYLKKSILPQQQKS